MRFFAGIVVLPATAWAEGRQFNGAPSLQASKVVAHYALVRVKSPMAPPYSGLRSRRDLSQRKWIVAPFLRRTMYPSPRPSPTTSATPNDSPTVCQHT